MNRGTQQNNDIVQSAQNLREKVQSSDPDNQVYSGDDDADWTLTYKPEEGTIYIAIRPNDFERRTAEHIADVISGEFGRSTPHLEEEEAGAFNEFVGAIDWTPN